MAENPQRNPPEQDSDYDGAWKESVRQHLGEFVAKYFAAIYGAIDWGRPVEWYDKEVSLVLGQAGSRNKRVDLLVKVWSGCFPASPCGSCCTGAGYNTDELRELFRLIDWLMFAVPPNSASLAC
jgi:hypothetical protein